MSLTQKRVNQIVKEELDRALKQRGLNEMMDPNYNDDLQSRLGRFTTPENVKGTPQYGRGPSPARKPEPGIYYPQDYTPPGGFGGGGGGNWDYSEYDHLREVDDDMDMDTGIDVVPDDEMGGEEDMEMGADDMTAPLEQEIDWAQFEDEDGEAVGAAFLDAVKQLQEENPDESPTAEAVVSLMQELLAGDTEEDMGDEDMGGEEMEDEGDFDDEAPMGDEEGALNEWVRRTNLLAGTSKRR